MNKIWKKTQTGAIQEWWIEVDGNRYRTHSGQVGGKITTSEWTVCIGKNWGKKNGTTGAEQALKEAQSKRTKKLESGYVEDLSRIEEVPFFKSMLAGKWEDRKDKIEYPIWSQPKLDGIRCIVTKDGMWSRNGKPIVSAPHIREGLDSLFQKDPELILDGELYSDKFSDDFNKIVSLVKKQKPSEMDLKESKEGIEYWVYDLPSTRATFGIRFEVLEELEVWFPWWVKLCPTHLVIDEEEVLELYEKYVEQGYEGQMLRLDEMYEGKRSNFLLKHKSFQDDEWVIVDVCEGEGNRTGTAGYMVLRGEDGKQFKSNVKGTREETAEMLRKRDELIGKMATVKYFNLTPDGVPRFPFVINVNREEYE